METIKEKFMDIAGLCERYGIKRTACYHWRQSEKFPSPITPKNCNPRWRLSDVMSWEEGNAAV